MLIIQGVVGETASLLVRQEVTVVADVPALETVPSVHTCFRIDFDFHLSVTVPIFVTDNRSNFDFH